MPEGKKWRGESVYKVLQPLREASELGSALFHIERASKIQIASLKDRAAKELLMMEITELQYVEHIDDLSFGGWDCKESPTDRCIYDIARDRHRDHCLFCGEPTDRG